MCAYVSGKKISLTAKLNPADTSLTADIDVWITTWRLYFKSDLQEEWMSYTGVAASWSDYIYSWLTRWLSQTADPATAWTGKTWLAWNKAVITAMHDQLLDIQQPTQILQDAKTYTTTTARDTALGWDWAALFNYTDIKCTDTWLFYRYNTTTNVWESVDTWTTTPNASTTTAGKVEEWTSAQSKAWTDTWETWARIFVVPSDIAKNTQSNTFISATASWTDTYTVSLTPTLTAYSTNMEVLVKIVNENTWASTLNIDSLWVKSIKDDVNWLDVLAWDLKANTYYKFIYDWTDFVVILQESISAVLNEDITAGDIVYLNNNGTLNKYYWINYGSDTISMSASNLNECDIIHLTSTKIAVIWNTGPDNKLRWVIWDISWWQITFWTQQDIRNTSWDSWASSAVRLSDTTFATFSEAQFWNNDWVVHINSVSWTVITVWAENRITFANDNNCITVIDTDKIAIWYRDWVWTYSVRACTISWTTVTFWTEQQFTAAAVSSGKINTISKIDTDKFLATSVTDAWLEIKAWTVSWTTITLWTLSSLSWTECFWLVLDTTNLVVWYKNTNYYARYLTVSWTTITQKTEYLVNWLLRWQNWNMLMLWIANNVYFTTIDTTWYTFSQVYTFINTSAFSWVNPKFVFSSNVWIIFNAWWNSTTVTVYMSDIALTKYISKNTATSWNKVKISQWVNKSQSSLIPWMKYYAWSDWNLTYATTDSLTNSLQELWTALTSTNIILND